MMILIFSIIVLVIAVFAAWHDFIAYQQKGRTALIMLSGLLLIGFLTEPKWWLSKSTSYALITDGFEEEVFNSNKYDSVYSLRDADKFNPQRKWLSSASMLNGRLSDGSQIDLFGYGSEELLPVKYQWVDLLNEPERGFFLHQAPQTVEVGREFEFVVLAKGAQTGDSIFVYKDGEIWQNREINEDRLRFVDRLYMQGPVSYDIEWEGDETDFSEILHIRAIQPELLTVGILMYSPSFEINYLAEHFGERGHRVISRSRIGQDRFRYDVVNAEVSQAESIMNNLAGKDVLFLDFREFLALPLSQQEQIKGAIQNGLDVILTAPSVEYSESWSVVFSELSRGTIEVQKLNRLEERNWLPSIFGSREELTTPISLLNLSINELSESAEILYDYTGNDAVAVRIENGTGSLTGHLFYRTYHWLIEGESETYNRFWVDYLSRTILKESSQFEITPNLARVHEKTNAFVTQSSSLERMMVKPIFDPDTLGVPVMDHSENAEVVSATITPRKTGWHFAEYGELKTWFYVYGYDEWRFDKAYRTYQQTSREIRQIKSTEIIDSINNSRKVPDWIWLLGFLAIQTILWAERKF
jgi:hypothetical protein